MAKQAKRGDLAPLAACKLLPANASDMRGVAAPSEPETSRGIDFRHALLRRADFAVANLSHALFSHANLARANLAKANLAGATLRFATASAADLEAADMSCADLQLACFDQANLSGANLGGALLDHASLVGADLANASLCGTSLRFASLADATLHAADLSGANLRHAHLDGADLSAADLRGAELDYADLSDVNLAHANLCGACLRYAKNMTRAQLAQVRASESTVLPLYFHAPAGRPWVRRQGDTANSRQIWIAGSLMGVFASLTLVWAAFAICDAILFGTTAIVPSGQGAAAPNVALRSATVADLRVEASDASRLIAAAVPEFAELRPAARVPDLVAAIPGAPAVDAGTLPANGAQDGAAQVLTRLTVPETVRSTEISPEMHALSAPDPPVLNDVVPPLVETVSASLAVGSRETVVEALEHVGAPATIAIAESPGFEPLVLIVSLREQTIDVYRGTSRVMTSRVSSGKRGYSTKAGVFSILEKRRHHHSNLYSNAPMPWMQRLTWTGMALHGGVVPGFPASHGCIRLTFSLAPKLFRMTTVGANVVVADNRIAPTSIEHATLFELVRPSAEVARVATERGFLASGMLTRAAAEPSEQTESTVTTALDSPANAPLRILVTRRTQRDEIITTQHLLASLGYLAPQNFSGRLGKETAAAIKAFQKAKGLPETGAFSHELVKKVHEAAGKAEPPQGHLFVRQNFRPVFDVPIAFRMPEQSLGTHVFTMGFDEGTASAKWTAISLQGGDAATVLDRLEIPDDVRERIAARLTPGSSLIVADTSIDSATVPDGDDFLVLAKAVPATAALKPRQDDVKQETAKKAKGKRVKAAAAKSRVQRSRKRVTRRLYHRRDLYSGFRLFRRW